MTKDNDQTSWQGQELLAEYISRPDQCQVEITGLSADSRESKPGDLYIAHAGPLEQRIQYIHQAISQGAVAVLREASETTPEVEFIKKDQRQIPLFAISN